MLKHETSTRGRDLVDLKLCHVETTCTPANYICLHSSVAWLGAVYIPLSLIISLHSSSLSLASLHSSVT